VVVQVLVDLIEAVDPLVDFSASREGPPLLPYVPGIQSTLTRLLTSEQDPEAVALAARGLASLATLSPSPLLEVAQVRTPPTYRKARPNPVWLAGLISLVEAL
jgi:hypothetical protein